MGRAGGRIAVAFIVVLAIAVGLTARAVVVLHPAAAATLLDRAQMLDAPPARTLATAADAALATLEHTVYRAPGRWNMCVPADCGSVNSDWGADSLTYALTLRWRISHDPSIAPLASALTATAPTYGRCTLSRCRMWSDIPMWDAVAAEREYEITRDPVALRKARRAFALVDESNAFARGACPAIDYQRPGGGPSALKTLETDSNYIKAALLLMRATGDRRYLAKAEAKYRAVRRYFLDPALPLYSVYVFDSGSDCRQLPHRFFASVNGNMISNGLLLGAATAKRAYVEEAVATASAVAQTLSDPSGVYVDLQAGNDVAEPLVEAMYELATQRRVAFARHWLTANAAVSAAAPSGVYGRFFGGPAPADSVDAWSANGGLALAIAAGALEPGAITGTSNLWLTGRFVAGPTTASSTIAFTGRAIALLGTIGERCCEAGHVRVFIDGTETSDRTGIWQNKSPAARALPNSVLLTWRWPSAGRHTIAFAPANDNAKEGGTYLHLTGYEYVP